MGRDLTKLGRNFLLSLGGEGVQSGFHFVLNLLLIRLLTAYEFGIFAIVFILGGIGLTYGSALITVPATLQISARRSKAAINYLDVIYGTVAVLVAAGMAMLVAVGLRLTIEGSMEAVAAGAFVGLWTLRNHVRAMMFARHATAAATLSDFSYSAAGIVLVGTLLLAGQLTAVANVLAVLALANLVGICVGLRSSYWRIRLSFRRSVFKRYRAMWSDVAWSLFGTTTWNIQGQGLMFVVASVVGPAAYAPIAAAGVLFSPLRPAMSAFVNVFRPDFVKALAERRSLHLAVVISGVCVAVICACIAMGAVIWILWPYLDAHIFGAKFANSAMPLIVTLSAIGAMVYLTYTVPMTLVQAAGEFRAVAVATFIGSIVGLAGISVALAQGAVPWSLAGAAAGELACGIYLSLSAYRILRATTRARGTAVKGVAALEMRA